MVVCTVKVDYSKFAITEDAFREASGFYDRDDIDYRRLKIFLHGRPQLTGARFATFFEKGYADFDAMEQQGLRSPVIVGAYRHVI